MTEDSTPSEPVEHLQRATDHLQMANDILESRGGGTNYVGAEHMTKALYQVRELARARERDDE